MDKILDMRQSFFYVSRELIREKAILIVYELRKAIWLAKFFELSVEVAESANIIEICQ